MMEAMFLLNAGSYKSHTASQPRREHAKDLIVMFAVSK
jgi:hypothetical protein